MHHVAAAGEAGFGSILNVAFGCVQAIELFFQTDLLNCSFAFGIAFALITSAATSGGCVLQLCDAAIN